MPTIDENFRSEFIRSFPFVDMIPLTYSNLVTESDLEIFSTEFTVTKEAKKEPNVLDHSARHAGALSQKDISNAIVKQILYEAEAVPRKREGTELFISTPYPFFDSHSSGSWSDSDSDPLGDIFLIAKDMKNQNPCLKLRWIAISEGKFNRALDLLHRINYDHSNRPQPESTSSSNRFTLNFSSGPVDVIKSSAMRKDDIIGVPNFKDFPLVELITSGEQPIYYTLLRENNLPLKIYTREIDENLVYGSRTEFEMVIRLLINVNMPEKIFYRKGAI